MGFTAEKVRACRGINANPGILRDAGAAIVTHSIGTKFELHCKISGRLRISNGRDKNEGTPLLDGIEEWFDGKRVGDQRKRSADTEFSDMLDR